jgi:hypothetical protein
MMIRAADAALCGAHRGLGPIIVLQLSSSSGGDEGGVDRGEVKVSAGTMQSRGRAGVRRGHSSILL